ncbi:putative insect origin recognition complex subunit [Fasciolopsis buskii]|uniref:Putative insect origin recognition complex subunit n=1 Tax=Fasciolopsis buskii TaxID=27845 RepID=A0A8E0S3P5_9TREM|nr:putative insect origin recognition complex subunit [Fasciolopsis buski]
MLSETEKTSRWYHFQVVLCITVLPVWSISAAPHVLRIREGTPAGTILIPDLVSFLADPSGAGPQSAAGGYDRTDGLLLAIGNAEMPSANWLTINPIRGSLVVKSPPDRDALCPSEFKFPETAISVDRGGIEFPDYAQLPNDLTRGGLDPGDCVLEVSIVHGSPTNPSFDILSVILQDVNDHAPTFSVGAQGDSDNAEYVIKLPESSRILAPHLVDSVSHELSVTNNIRIPLPSAKDPDYGANGIRGYRLEGQDAHLFRLEVGPAVSDPPSANSEMQYPRPPMYTQAKSSQLWLVPVDSQTGRASSANRPVLLDREEREVYHFVLLAFDGGSPQRTGRLPIRLVIEDVNDNAPKFSQAWYSGKLSEKDLPGQVILEFSAYDADAAGANSRIGFRIPGEPESASSLNSGSGRKPTESSVAGLSEAQIAASNYFAVEQVPADASGISSTVHALKRLNVTYGRLVVRRQSREKMQKAASHALEISRRKIMSSSTKRLGQDVYSTAGMNAPTNQDEGARLEFVIEAYDHGHPVSLSSQVPVYVQVTDVNDHAPKIFVSYLREAEHLGRLSIGSAAGSSGYGIVRENLGRAMLAQVTVTDEDTLYADTDLVCTTNDSRFTLEDISILGRFGDLTSSWSRRSTIPLSDQPTKPNTGSTMEEITSDTTKKRIKRAILPTRMYKLMLNAPFDRESSTLNQMAAVQFTLTCSDNARGQLPGGQLTTTVPIRILIEDANDNAPVFEQTHYTFRVPENYPAMKPAQLGAVNERYLVGRVHATDADEGWNAALEYRLVFNPSSSLELERLTGQLFLTRPLDRESVSEIVFQVLAIDCIPEEEPKFPATVSTDVRMTGTAEVRMIVEDMNDSPPVFQEMNYHFEVEEGVDLVKVGQVWATDADQDEFARISYRLAVGPGSRFPDHLGSEQKAPKPLPNQLYDEALEISTHFQIDPNSGIIHLKGRLDRERRAHYEFVVLAVDNPRALSPKLEGPLGTKQGEVVQFTGTATVLITVLDRNDNAPRVLSPRNHAQFSLGPDQLIAGNTIFTIRATDPDLGENGTIEYALLGVEDELGSWVPAADGAKELGKNTTSIHWKQSNSVNATKSVTEFPFAVDQTAGICYLRENLPPLNADGPRAYLLRMRAYDLGRPQSLNTSFTVRVVRQASDSSEMSFVPDGISDHVSGQADMPFRAHPPPGDQSMGLGSVGTWTAVAGQARISDRTMVVILSTVFVLLLLTTIVLLLLVRYRRLFLRNISLGSAHSADGSIGKVNAGEYSLNHCNRFVRCNIKETRICITKGRKDVC